jgi:hypothetical protein
METDNLRSFFGLLVWLAELAVWAGVEFDPWQEAQRAHEFITFAAEHPDASRATAVFHLALSWMHVAVLFDVLFKRRLPFDTFGAGLIAAMVAPWWLGWVALITVASWWIYWRVVWCLLSCLFCGRFAPPPGTPTPWEAWMMVHDFLVREWDEAWARAVEDYRRRRRQQQLQKVDPELGAPLVGSPGL